jgi:hypothetical protein
MPERPDVLERPAGRPGSLTATCGSGTSSLGGMRTALEVEAYLYGALMATTHDRDLIAVALNERFSELGGDHPIPYSDDESSAD